MLTKVVELIHSSRSVDVHVLVSVFTLNSKQQFISCPLWIDQLHALQQHTFIHQCFAIATGIRSFTHEVITKQLETTCKHKPNTITM